VPRRHCLFNVPAFEDQALLNPEDVRGGAASITGVCWILFAMIMYHQTSFGNHPLDVSQGMLSWQRSLLRLIGSDQDLTVPFSGLGKHHY
jgi:hypothetical protein